MILRVAILVLLPTLCCLAQPVYSTEMQIREIPFSTLRVLAEREPASRISHQDVLARKAAPDGKIWVITKELVLKNDHTSERYDLGPEEGTIFVDDMALGQNRILINFVHSSEATREITVDRRASQVIKETWTRSIGRSSLRVTRDGQLFLKQYMTPPGDGGYRIEELESRKVLVRSPTPTSDLILDSQAHSYLFVYRTGTGQCLDLVNRKTKRVSRIQFSSISVQDARFVDSQRLQLWIERGQSNQLVEVELP